ncbi:MAG TPA: gamma carbonic anhydrase family protein [Gemmatimonadaceae bacterium]|nr:gamma carbonic anhydrase family protein [Gemmatimonadaceae bacterium]
MNIHPTVFIHERALIVGDVTLGAHVSVWPMAVVRADSAAVVVGAASNIQDGVVIHVDPGLPATIGARVTVGHRAIIHGATVEDDSLIGMGAILLNGVQVGRNSIVGAGAVCPERMMVPPGSLVLGVPGRVVRETTPAERQRIARSAESYQRLMEGYRRGSGTAAAPGE